MLASVGVILSTLIPISLIEVMKHGLSGPGQNNSHHGISMDVMKQFFVHFWSRAVATPTTRPI